MERTAVTPLPVGTSVFAWGTKTYVLGIVNATPDSFSGDGVMQSESWIDEAIALAKRHVQNGADILDLGGESTRPSATPISVEDELQRVVPLIQRLSREVLIPISIDTYKAAVAEAALAAGASLINDVWGGRRDPAILQVAATHEAPIVLMHNTSDLLSVEKTELGARYVGASEGDVVERVMEGLHLLVSTARAAGVKDSQIILDVGFGFGKTTEENIELLREFRRFTELGFPLLSGTSRKSFIGYTLDLPPHERIEGTAATVALSIAGGADMVRVHDVKEMVRVACMTDAVVRNNI